MATAINKGKAGPIHGMQSSNVSTKFLNVRDECSDCCACAGKRGRSSTASVIGLCLVACWLLLSLCPFGSIPRCRLRRACAVIL